MNHLDGVIDVKDLFAELIRKAWLIILCTVLFMGALGAYAFVQNQQSTENEDSVESRLEEEELEATMDYVMAVLEFYNLGDYLDNSIMMTCNPYNLYQTELKYVIFGDIEKDDIATIRSCYENYVLYGQLMNDIANVDKDYKGKVLLNALTIDTEAGLQTDSSKIVSVLIYAKDEKQSKELAAYAKEQLELYSNDVAKQFSSHKLELLSDATIQTVDLDLIFAKESYEKNYELVEADMEALGAPLSVSQKEYAVEILKESLDKKALKELKIEESFESGNTFGVVKYAVLGGGVGFAMAIVLIVALYFFTNQIKSEKEVEHLYGIKHFGNCPVYKRTAFDKLADKIFYKSKTYDLDGAKDDIIEELIALCKENEIKEIGFCGSADTVVSSVLKDICKKLEEVGIECVRIGNLFEDNAELPRNVVGIELVKKTALQDIAKEIEICNAKNISQCGYITFSK